MNVSSNSEWNEMERRICVLLLPAAVRRLPLVKPVLSLSRGARAVLLPLVKGAGGILPFVGILLEWKRGISLTPMPGTRATTGLWGPQRLFCIMAVPNPASPPPRNPPPISGTKNAWNSNRGIGEKEVAIKK